MDWSVNNSISWSSNPNSTMSSCVACLHVFPRGYAAALICFSLLVLPLKGWVVWLQVSSPMTEKTNLLIYNLFINDLLLTFISLLSMLSIFLSVLPYLWSFLIGLTAFGHPLFQCLLCVERYLAVKHPTVFLKYRPLRYRVGTVITSWISVFIVCFLSVALCAPTHNHIISYHSFQCATFILIFSIKSFCCVSVLQALIRPPPGARRKERQKDNMAERHNANENQKKKQAFMIILMSQVCVITFYLPPVALMFMYHELELRHFCGVYIYNISHIHFTSVIFYFRYLNREGKLKWMNCRRKR